MKVSKVTLSLLVFFCVLTTAQTTKPRVAIKTFESPANSRNSTIGNALTDILITELAKTGRYTIVEREAAEELLREIDFGRTDWAKSSTFAGKGHLAGAEYFLLGKVSNFSYTEEQAQVATAFGGQLVTVYVQSAEVRVDFRLVSTRSAGGRAFRGWRGAGCEQEREVGNGDLVPHPGTVL